MPKRLILLRHAAAQIGYSSANDKDRPITMEGIQELEAMRVKVKSHFTGLNLVVCSNAKRARQTLEGFKNFLPTSAEIRYENKINDITHNALWSYIQKLPEKYERVMIVGHNPCFSRFVQEIDMQFPGFSTCNAVILDGKFEKWTFSNPFGFQVSHFLRPF